MPREKISPHQFYETLPEGVYTHLRESILARGGFYFITGNPDKASETKDILARFEVDLVVEARKIQGLPPEIQGQLGDIAGEKAIQVFRKQDQLLTLSDSHLLRKDGLILPIAVEDTALEISELAKMPGVYVKALFEGSEEDGCQALVRMARGTNHRAVARTVFAFPVDRSHALLFEGEVSGTIAEEVWPQEYGFGWDRVFIPHGYDVPFSAMDPGVKNAISMRAQALRKLAEFLRYE